MRVEIQALSREAVTSQARKIGTDDPFQLLIQPPLGPPSRVTTPCARR
jgi:hypothetical protein